MRIVVDSPLGMESANSLFQPVPAATAMPDLVVRMRRAA
jgi:hypothetical protein